MSNKTNINVSFTEAELLAIDRLISSFFEFYDTNSNNKTWREWMGYARPTTLESVQQKSREAWRIERFKTL